MVPQEEAPLIKAISHLILPIKMGNQIMENKQEANLHQRNLKKLISQPTGIQVKPEGIRLFLKQSCLAGSFVFL